MPSVAVAHLAISRLVGASAHIAGLDLDYARETLKNGFDAPEASAAENCCLLFGHDELDAREFAKLRFCRTARSYCTASSGALGVPVRPPCARDAHLSPPLLN